MVALRSMVVDDGVSVSLPSPSFSHRRHSMLLIASVAWVDDPCCSQQCIDRSLMMRVGPDPGTTFGTRTVDTQYKRTIGSGGRGLENIMNCDGDECTPHPREPSFVFLLVRFPWDSTLSVGDYVSNSVPPFLLSLLSDGLFHEIFSSLFLRLFALHLHFPK